MNNNNSIEKRLNVDKEQKKPQPTKKSSLKEETLNKETLDILKKINTGVSKISLVNKNVLKINDGVKSLNAKIVNTNLGVKSMNMKLSKIDVNMAKLLSAMTNQKAGKNDKGVSYLDEQLQNETLAQSKKANVTLDKILVAVSKNGTVIKKDGGSGLLGGLLAVTGLKMLSGMIGQLTDLIPGGKAAKVAGGVAAGVGGAGVLGKVLGKGGGIGKTLKTVGKGGLWGTLGLIGLNSLFGDKKIDLPIPDEWKETGAYKRLAGAGFLLENKIENAIKDAIPEINIAQKDWWKDMFGGVGETLYDMTKNYSKDIGNMFDESTKKTLMGFFNQDWMKLETWEKLYSDPDNFLRKMGEAGMKLNSNMGSLGIPMLDVGPYSGGTKETPPINFGKESPVQKTNRTAYMAFAEEEAIKQGLDPNLIKAIIQQESNWRADAVSSAGASGLMQLMPGTAKDMGVEDVFDPYQNIKGGVKYFKQLLSKYDGNVDKALAAYNWGMGNVDRKGMSNMPSETTDYLSKVVGYKESFENEPMVFSGKPTVFASDVEQKVKDKYAELIENKKAKEVEFIDNLIYNLSPKPNNNESGLLSTDRSSYGRGPLVPVKEAPTTNQLQSSAIEKDKLSMVKPEPQQPNVISQVVNNGAVGQETQKIDSFSPFDIYTKGLHNPYYNRA